MPTKRLFTGQILEATLGLYFFNARWYDSSLGRFIQPDTVIPSPYDPASYDRFAYAKNSPTNYLDPSGHSSTSTCRVYRDDVCVVVRPNVHSANYYTYLLERDYGITLSNEKGTWSFKNITNLLGALIEMDNALPGISRFTSGTIFYFYSDSKFYGGKVVTNDSITFHSPESGIPYQTYWHEVGHLIDKQSGGWFTRHLGEQVNAPDGTYVMGGTDTIEIKKRY